MKFIERMLTIGIAAVWLVNGFFFKMLNLVPRHESIVEAILGAPHSRLLTFVIGLAETGMALWVLSGFRRKINAVVQIVTVAGMNLLEFFLVPGLLLWGRMNAFFALLFILLIGWKAFYLDRKTRVYAVIP